MKEEIKKRLFALQDTQYKAFHSKLVPNINADKIIGVRTPELRKLAKEYAKNKQIDDFLASAEHDYYEETNLHGFIISETKDYDQCIKELDRFLPVVDNWATCDLLSPKVFKQKKNHERLIEDIKRWMSSDQPYTVRFGIEMLMSYFLDDDFKPEYLQWVAKEKGEHYYIKMMVAWFFATALAKQWDAAIPFIEQKTMDKWVHNKAIQKAVESYRITDSQKAYLRTLKK
ncbi:MAG: DNA alkylation repair protein [Paludibacteraceae bacterium]|nr:DNA alkylation repair protein [Paludibacteraceae bacterium]MBR6103673.1 DNA alkylation repair protein [Paludibacteraceae bacterium]